MFTVLHIDNSHFFNKIVETSIKAMGYNFISANDISGAVYELENNSIDLIITGLELKGGGGEYFIKQLNSGDYKDIPVIVMTSTDSMDVRFKMFKSGVVDYIPKDKTFEKSLTRFLNKLSEKDRAKNLLQQMHIAVLDDSQTQLQVIKNILTLNNVNHVDFFESAIELVDNQKPYHIYILDLVMPDISGEQMILRLRTRFPESVIIAISGIDNYKVVSNVLLSGADDYMLKPFNSSIFMARLISNVRMYMLIKELKQKNRELKYSLITDPLTKMYNHRFIFQRLEEEVEKSKDNKKKLSIIFFAVDNFEALNDNFGHGTGDKVLVKIADVIKSEVSNSKLTGRYGGVEFVVLLPGKSVDDAVKIAESIRVKVAKIKIKDFRVTISGGCCERPEKANARELIKVADTLLFNAKKAGKNRIEHDFDWEKQLK
jgi:two-component system cell cycle response regulator